MTPLNFQARYAASWDELEGLLDEIEKAPRLGLKWSRTRFDQGARLSELYRLSCEHLALASSRTYPPFIITRLQALTHRAHQIIYRHRGFGMDALRQLVLYDFPVAVRAHRGYVWIATLVFVLPMLLAGVAAYFDPDFVLHFMKVEDRDQYERMYSEAARKIGQPRQAEDDWKMLGYYIKHNIGIGFQCFASGLFAGVGSLLLVLYNGLHIGVVAGFLTSQGHAENFYSFVVTHASVELTAIVLAGAAGLRLGHAVVAPGRRTRLEALKHHASGAVVLMYGVFGMLVIAAFLEAFWSSSRWIAPWFKYGAGGLGWILVLSYLIFQGRAAAGSPKGPHAGE